MSKYLREGERVLAASWGPDGLPEIEVGYPHGGTDYFRFCPAKSGVVVGGSAHVRADGYAFGETFGETPAAPRVVAEVRRAAARRTMTPWAAACALWDSMK